MGKNLPKKKRAFYVANDEDADIRFAHSPNVLRKGELQEWEEITRKPEYDSYVDLGYVPAERLVSDGWTFRCYECDKEVNSEHWDYEEDVQLHPVYSGRVVFCSQICHDFYHHQKQLTKENKERTYADLMSRFPGIEITCGWAGPDRAHVTFTFPGGEGDVEWTSEDPTHVYIQQRDLDAWNAYKESIKELATPCN